MDDSGSVANRPFRRPFTISLIATPVALLLGFLSGGAGHGDYLLTKFLFPFTMLSTVIFGEIVLPFVLLALIQFPFYGVILGFANRRSLLQPVAVGLLVVHLGSVVLCMVLITENFS